ncbi:hypothetical protein [Thiothrix sp.]|jgi:hypothetical protein|uniref:DUF6948 domain-containing protein n=1 Tax=Thiothrix sp. TaxID=1032 RepID=UPI00257E0049|nr:hypothetical protein [Thiothrix sp.]
MSLDINSLTLGQIKEINAIAVSMGIAQSNSSVGAINSRYVGKYVIVRSGNEGINAGEVVMADDTGIVLKDARRVWYHRPADETSWYEGVANSGLRSDSKVSVAVEEKAIIEDYSIILCSSSAEKSIRGFKAYAQS